MIDKRFENDVKTIPNTINIKDFLKEEVDNKCEDALKHSICSVLDISYNSQYYFFLKRFMKETEEIVFEGVDAIIKETIKEYCEKGDKYLLELRVKTQFVTTSKDFNETFLSDVFNKIDTLYPLATVAVADFRLKTKKDEIVDEVLKNYIEKINQNYQNSKEEINN